MVHIVKIYFENSKKEKEIRRLAVSSDVVSDFKHLLEKIQNVYQLSDDGNLEIKWKDPENDFILMSSDDELAQAVANTDDGLLRLYLNLKKGVSEPKNGSEDTNIPKCQPTGDLHPLVICDGCDSKIVGIRYKCLQCRNFDFCSTCEADKKHPNHDMIKLVKPTYIPREWAFYGARKLWRSMFGRCPSTYFTFFEAEKEPTPPRNTEDSVGSAYNNCQAEENTSPKGSSDNPADCQQSCNVDVNLKMGKNSSTFTSKNADFQSKEKSSPKPPKDHPSPPWELPSSFMQCLNGDFVDAQKLFHDGLNQFMKTVQGTIEVKVDHPKFKTDFKVGEQRKGNENEAGHPTASAPNKTNQAEKSSTVKKSSANVSNQASEGILHHTADENENDCTMHTDNDKLSTGSAPDNKKDDNLSMRTENDALSSNVVAPSVNEDEICIDTDGNQSSSNLTAAKEKENVIVPVNDISANAVDVESTACVEGWTFLNGDDANKMECAEGNAEPERVAVYPEIMEIDPGQENKNYIETKDPLMISAVKTMQSMGFTNEGGWLEKLLISKQGNINEALDALYPSQWRGASN